MDTIYNDNIFISMFVVGKRMLPGSVVRLLTDLHFYDMRIYKDKLSFWESRYMAQHSQIQ